jgi:LacI family transcriptional regulator
MRARLKEIAIVLDPSTARRLTPGILAYLKPDKVFWLIDALRPEAELFGQLAKWKPDGIITRIIPNLTKMLRKLGKPAVVCGGDIAGPLIGSVTTDNVQVGVLAAQHLLEVGLRHFAFFGLEAPFSAKRERGFAAALRMVGLDHTSYHDAQRNWVHYMELLHVIDASLIRWLRQLPKPIGIFAAHDPLGWHLAQVCRHAGIAVPEEVAIVSVNNDELVCNLANPPFSSVAMPWRRNGAEIALALDRLLDAVAVDRRRVPTGQVVSIPPEGVVTRQSTNLLAVDDPLLRRALQFIREHAGTPITVDDILTAVPISRRKLEIDFQQQLRRTPKEEITRVRLERAKLLLAQTDLPIPIVAERCGYHYAERFTVAFRRQMNLPPIAFRRDHRLHLSATPHQLKAGART